MAESQCHPERKNYARGLCQSCWQKRWLAENPDKKQKHKDRNKAWRKNNPEKMRARRDRELERRKQKRIQEGRSAIVRPRCTTHRLELSGLRFGRLLVGKCCGVDRKHYTLWKCQCDCGKTCTVKGVNIRLGVTQSCGCLLHDVCVTRGKRVAAKNLLRGHTIPGSAFRELFSGYKRNARSRDMEWSLSIEKFLELTSSPCFYTGLAPAQVIEAASGEQYIYNGVDRVDRFKGYTVDNCVPCSSAINRMKFDLSQEQFMMLCHLVARHCRPKKIVGMNEGQLLMKLTHAV